jgi:NAD(P)-dependent dehydrogenase (short-subunit alcohol dehydrogenase family)
MLTRALAKAWGPEITVNSVAPGVILASDQETRSKERIAATPAKRQGRAENEFAWQVTADEVKARGYNLDFKNPHAVTDEHGNPEELLAKLDEAEGQANTLRDQLKTILAEALLR